MIWCLRYVSNIGRYLKPSLVTAWQKVTYQKKIHLSWEYNPLHSKAQPH